ncbi:hypothetical protein BLA24_01750 [Streptomyces cinnamoneus]|uniref:Uncharacterized protein n=1 Tax=Streptomyces cinnamoneus TaxID=53446 RepID=A0A2G1XQ41_STRCJ|nr:hypothetical protein BLA24_01750 [Streptomyces cinnamoneus]
MAYARQAFRARNHSTSRGAAGVGRSAASSSAQKTSSSIWSALSPPYVPRRLITAPVPTTTASAAAWARAGSGAGSRAAAAARVVRSHRTAGYAANGLRAAPARPWA